MLTRNVLLPPDVKIVDMMRTNLMILDIILEENDRVVICGSVNVMDHDNMNMALMVQMTPAIMKKMSTLFQVTYAEPPIAVNYPWHCYIFKGISRNIESLAEICSLDTWCVVELAREGPGALHEIQLAANYEICLNYIFFRWYFVPYSVRTTYMVACPSEF
jgi:hypothetical protein